MIQINLLPGGKKKARGRSSGPSALSSLGPLFSRIAARVQDPYLGGAAVGVALTALYIGVTYVNHTAREAELTGRQDAAVADSAHYAVMLREKATATAQRDSVMRQLQIIRSIDADRFIWPHVMDEISRALPPYTWLASIQQTSALDLPAQMLDSPNPDSAKKAKEKDKDKAAAADTVRRALQFRIVGNTADIQALTRFMKDLEASPFVQKVTLVKSDLAVVDGKGVTQFQLDCEYQTPDPAAIRMVPISLLTR